MEKTTIIIVKYLYVKRIIGGKHIPEDRIIMQRKRLLRKEECKLFEKDYKKLVNDKIILRMKKRTGKGCDWHITLNPRMLEKALEIIQ
ncbi:MAG: hypothetical protein ABIJ21_03905 [Nanoarchaeota archaeon]